MIRAAAIIGLALVAAAAIAPGVLMAAGDVATDPALRVVPRPPALALDPRPVEKPPAARAGNPLWAIPLSSLAVTRERPIFSASRRPPVPPAVAPLVRAPPPPPPRPAAPERPQLSLVGTVAGGEGIAVFVDQTNQSIVRLRTGEGHGGWVLRAVGGREVTLQNEHDTAVLALPSPDGR